MNKLDGKVVVITGGCGNLGYATAKALAGRGARIISIVRRDVESAQTMMNQLPNSHLKHLAVNASVTNSASLKAAVASLDITKCDILINNAGREHRKVVYKEISDNIVNDIIDTNVKGLFYSVREFVTLIYKSEEPIIINISSASSKGHGKSNLLYSASKAAVDAMTRDMASNMAPKVRVIGIAPSWLETPVSGTDLRTDQESAILKYNIPLKRFVSIAEVVEAIETVATGFKFMTGTIIPVDCGITSRI
jgi:3-oxoacyl-[acyl-carrier protein] reductase